MQEIKGEEGLGAEHTDHFCSSEFDDAARGYGRRGGEMKTKDRSDGLFSHEVSRAKEGDQSDGTTFVTIIQSTDFSTGDDPAGS